MIGETHAAKSQTYHTRSRNNRASWLKKTISISFSEVFKLSPLMTYGLLLAVTGLAVAHASKVAVDVNTKVSVRRCRERDAVFFPKTSCTEEHPFAAYMLYLKPSSQTDRSLLPVGRR